MDKKLNIYDRFVCIAGECPITCCQEWKIAVDADTKSYWKKLGKTGNGIRLCDCIIKKEDTDVIKLNHAHQCPFLNEEKLCRLVIEFGDRALSETCRIFPRQILHFEDHDEYCLMPGCPAVVDLLNKAEKVEVPGTSEGETASFLEKLRDFLFELIENESFSVEKSLMMGFYILLELYERFPAGDLTDDLAELKKVMNPKYLKELSDIIDNMTFQEADTFYERNELFLDLIENYRKENMYSDFLGKTGAIAEHFSESEDELTKQLLKEKSEVQKTWNRLFRNYLKEEIFADFLHPDRDFRGCIMAYQWMALNYAAVCQAVFLSLYGEKEKTYEKVREAIVIMSRMTGYDDQDIEEYLKNSFEEEIWEWGYLALLMGNPKV